MSKSLRRKTRSPRRRSKRKSRKRSLLGTAALLGAAGAGAGAVAMMNDPSLVEHAFRQYNEPPFSPLPWSEIEKKLPATYTGSKHDITNANEKRSFTEKYNSYEYLRVLVELFSLYIQDNTKKKEITDEMSEIFATSASGILGKGNYYEIKLDKEPHFAKIENISYEYVPPFAKYYVDYIACYRSYLENISGPYVCKNKKSRPTWAIVDLGSSTRPHRLELFQFIAQLEDSAARRFLYKLGPYLDKLRLRNIGWTPDHLIDDPALT